MKILFDALIFSQNRMDGLNRYTLELLKGIDKAGVDFKILSNDSMLADLFGTRVIKAGNSNMSLNNFKGNMSRLVFRQTVLPGLIRKLKPEVYYNPLPEGMFRPVCPQIVTVHDLLPAFYPETFPRLKYYFKWIAPFILKSSNKIISVSESTKKDIVQYYKIQPEKINVVYQTYRKEVFYPRQEHEIEKVKERLFLDRYILCVGETRAYKNIRGAIQAFAGIHDKDLKLVIVGKISRLDPEIALLPEKLGIKNKVVFTGFVDDTDLAALYSGAQAFLFPSLYEGFGIPPLEAMACGCPVIVSDRASLHEVCGDTAVYVDPENLESIKNAIDNSSQDITGNGIIRARRFSSSQFTASFLKALD